MEDKVSIQQLPPDMRPREKILTLGPAALTDTELLALLLRTGINGKTVFAFSCILIFSFSIMPLYDGSLAHFLAL